MQGKGPGAKGNGENSENGNDSAFEPSPDCPLGSWFFMTLSQGASMPFLIHDNLWAGCTVSPANRHVTSQEESVRRNSAPRTLNLGQGCIQ